MIKSNKIKTLALTLGAVIVLASCTSNSEVPTLIEPVGAEPTFRPVETADMGDAKIIVGTVMGQEYCHFYEKMIEIKDIYVSIGDYVNEGDILVEADLDSVRDQITELNSELSVLDAGHEADEKKYEIELAKLELQKEEAEYDKNLGFLSEDYVKSFDKTIETFEENHLYSGELYEFQRRKINESITELNKIVNDGVIRAKKSGYVTYKKDLKAGNSALSFENLVTVTDPEDLFIASTGDTRSYNYSKYPVKFAFVEGRKVPITEYAYSDSETVYSKAQNLYPIQRFKTEEETNLEMGDFVLLEFYANDKNDVLVVGKDSVNTDDKGSFVYVKSDDGSLEKRYFEMGASDNHNYEVLGGLEEGEMVLYSQEATLPKMEEQYEVKLKAYDQFETAKGIKYVEQSVHSYFSSDEGEVVEIYANELEEVKKGDPILKIMIDSEKGKLVGIENEIKSENRKHENSVNDSEKRYEHLNKEIRESESDSRQKNARLEEIKIILANSNTSDADKVKLAKEKSDLEFELNKLVYTIKSDEMELKILEIDKDFEKKQHDNTIASLNRQLTNARKNNDGTGFKTIYAEYDGKITSMPVAERDKVTVGKKLAESSYYFDNVIKFGGQHDPEPVGYKFDITMKDEKYPAEVIAGNNNPFAHVFTENGKVYCTQPAMDLNTFYMRVDDEKFFSYDSQFMTEEISYFKFSLDNMLTVPGNYVFKEISFDKKEYYYVWVLNGDTVYKRYVQTGMDQRLGSLDKPVIINGLHEGDILVK
ncbi:MAG: hypothetical protein J6X80_05710 [Lachnospiraceae bacterium]|nr:hypothetical protein [Lachnospiraceae bacterium]